MVVGAHGRERRRLPLHVVEPSRANRSTREGPILAKGREPGRRGGVQLADKYLRYSTFECSSVLIKVYVLTIPSGGFLSARAL